MILRVITCAIGTFLQAVAFANTDVALETNDPMYSDEYELLAFESTSTVPPKRYPINTVRLQNMLYDGCLARDDQRSIVRLWDCRRSSRRYNWRIYDTYDEELFYFVNDGFDRRCLAVEDDGRTVIGPTCATVRSHLWFLRLPGSNVNLTRDQVRDLESISGYTGQLQIVSNMSEGCLGTRDYSHNNQLRALDCFQNPNPSQVFNVNPPGPIN